MMYTLFSDHVSLHVGESLRHSQQIVKGGGGGGGGGGVQDLYF